MLKRQTSGSQKLATEKRSAAAAANSCQLGRQRPNVLGKGEWNGELVTMAWLLKGESSIWRVSEHEHSMPDGHGQTERSSTETTRVI